MSVEFLVWLADQDFAAMTPFRGKALSWSAWQFRELSCKVLHAHTVPGLVTAVEWRGDKQETTPCRTVHWLACHMLEVPMSQGLEFNNGGRKESWYHLRGVTQHAGMIPVPHRPSCSLLCVDCSLCPCTDGS